MQLPGLTIGIVADDLTGANDTALQFFLAGCDTQILLGLNEPPDGTDADVWAVNTNTRHVERADAANKVRRAVALLRDRYGVENFYKKIDSTLRGHIVPECLAILDELGWDCAVVVPAYPEQGRLTVGGYQLVRGMPLERTEVARDPLFPVNQSHLPTLLKQNSNDPDRIGYIPLSTVMHGAGPIYMALGEQVKDRKRIIVIDACSNTDLEQIGLAIEKIRKSVRVLPCGSAGLAQAMTRIWTGGREEESLPLNGHELHTPVSPILIASGSNSGISRNQIYQLIENYPYYGEGSRLEIFDLSPEKILGLSSMDDLVARMIEALDKRNTVVVSTALKEDSYYKTLELAEANNIPVNKLTSMVHEVLTRVTQAVLAHKPAKLVLAGGETATRITSDIGSRTLRIMAEVEPAIPLTLDQQGRWIVTKSGAFGSPLALANIVKYLKQCEDASA